MELTELPLGLPGRVFRSVMPFSDYDPHGRALVAFREGHVSVVVLLAEQDECVRNAKRDLRRVYLDEGFALIHLPIPDFTVPAPEVLQPAVREALQHARSGHHVAIHCHAGRGRTGLFAACLAREALGLSGHEAIAWIRRHIPGAVETPPQEQLVREYSVEG